MRNVSLRELLLCVTDAIEAIPLKGVMIVTLEAMKPEVLEGIRADDTTGKPVGMIERIVKKKDTLQDLLLQRKDKEMIHIGEAEALTWRGQTHLVVKERSYVLSVMILNIWQGSVKTLFATDTTPESTDAITVPM